MSHKTLIPKPKRHPRYYWGTTREDAVWVRAQALGGLKLREIAERRGWPVWLVTHLLYGHYTSYRPNGQPGTPHNRRTA